MYSRRRKVIEIGMKLIQKRNAGGTRERSRDTDRVNQPKEPDSAQLREALGDDILKIEKKIIT